MKNMSESTMKMRENCVRFHASSLNDVQPKSFRSCSLVPGIYLLSGLLPPPFEAGGGVCIGFRVNAFAGTDVRSITSYPMSRKLFSACGLIEYVIATFRTGDDFSEHASRFARSSWSRAPHPL